MYHHYQTATLQAFTKRIVHLGAMLLVAIVGSSALIGCGGGGGGGGGSATVVTVNPPVSGTTDASLSASQSGDLLSYVKNKILNSTAQNPSGVLETVSLAGAPVATAAPSAGVGGASAAPVAFAGTRLQEQGVDEDDLVKTDGSMLYALSPQQFIYTNATSTVVPAQVQAQRRLADGTLQAAGVLKLDAKAQPSGMFLASAVQRIAVIGQTQPSYRGGPLAPTTLALPPAGVAAPVGTSVAPFYSNPQISLDVLSAGPTATMTIAHTVRMDGSLVGSRMIGNQLYVVSTWSPNLARYLGTATTSLTTADILPSVQVGTQTAQPLVQDTDCYLQAANASNFVQITTITAFDLASAGLQRSSRCFVGASNGLYVSPSNVYIASSRYHTYADNVAATVFRSNTTTDIHKFALQGAQISYKGSGEVPGHLGWDKDKLSYRMSEYQGDLRVLSFTGETGWNFAVTTNLAATSSVSTAPASPATLSILREDASQKLKIIGSLPNSQRPSALGKPGEQVYGVQFVGPRAYVVTFRRVDPLYVVDASNPVDPKITGELEMPGFSDYLYPMGANLLLGIGKDATNAGRLGGVKVALMNVSNPASPSIVGSIVTGKAGSGSALDSSAHGVNIFEQSSGVYRIALPVRVHDTASGNTGFYQPTTQALHRFEVNTSAQTLVSKPAIVSTTFPANDPYGAVYRQFDVGQDRSVQIDANVYYFTGGGFLSAVW